MTLADKQRVSETSPPSNQLSVGSRYLIITGSILAGLFLLVLILPSFLSTTWGKDQVLGMVNDRIPGSMSVGDLNLGWFSKIKASNIEVKDPDGRTVATIQSFSSDATPLGLLFHSITIGNATVSGVHVELIQDAAGVTNLHRSLFPAMITAAAVTRQTPSDAAKQQLILSVPFTGHLTISDASIALTAPDIERVTLDEIQADLEASKGIANIRIQGLSHQADLSGHFAVDLSVRGMDSAGNLVLKQNSEGLPLPEGNGEVSLKLNIENASVDIFDQVLTLGSPHITGIMADALGSTLNLRLDTLLTSAGPQVELSGDSANFHADLNTRLRDGKVVLESPGKVSLKITPELFRRLSHIKQPDDPLLVLKDTVLLDLELERMTLPTRLTGGMAQPTLRVKVALHDAVLVGQKPVGQILLSGVSGVIERLEASGALLLNMSGTIEQGGQTGSLRIGGRLPDGSSTIASGQTELVIAANDLPTQLIDYLTHANGLLVDMIGPNFDVNTKLRAGQGKPTFDIQVGSDVVAIPSLQFAVDNGLRLTKPAQIHFHATPTLVRFALGKEHPIELHDKTSVLVYVRELLLPYGYAGGLHGVVIDADVATAPFFISGLFGKEQERARLSNVKCAINTRGDDKVSFNLHSDAAADGVTPLLTATLGEASTMNAQGELLLTENGSWEVGETRLSIQSELIDLRAAGRVSAKGILTLSSPATLRYNFKPEVLLALGLIQPGLPHIEQKMPMELRVDELFWDLAEANSRRLLARGKVSIADLDVVDDQNQSLATMRDATVAWRYDGIKQSAGLVVRAKTQAETKEGSLHATVDVDGWLNPPTASFETEVAIHQMPTSFVTAFSGDNTLSKLVGDSLDLAAKAHFGEKGTNTPGTLQATLSGHDLQADMSFSLNDPENIAVATKPILITWTVTPERADTLFNVMTKAGWATPLPWKLREPTNLILAVTEFKLPWDLRTGALQQSSQREWCCPPGFVALASLNGVKAVDFATGEDVLLERFALQLRTPNIEESLEVKLEAKEGAIGDRVPAELLLEGKLDRVRTGNGWLRPEELCVDLSLKGTELPLTNLLRYPLQRAAVSEQLATLIGERVNGTVKFNLVGPSGTVQAALNGTGGKFELDATIKDQILSLNQPLSLDLQVTKELREGLIRELAPYAAGIQSTEAPVSLTIDPAGFAFPLTATNLLAVKIPKATFDLGKVKLDVNSPLGSVSSVLTGERGRQSGTMNVWFTPLTLSLSDGVLRINRMDALVADRYPIALWGKVDLVKDRVRMIVGITAQALKAAYTISHLNERYVLQLPLTGTLDNVAIDKAKATARVTALVAQSHGSKEGIMIGGVLDLLSGGGKEDAVPPPSGPLPWDHGKTVAEQPTEQPGASVQSQGFDVNKVLKDGTKKLLDVFR